MSEAEKYFKSAAAQGNEEAKNGLYVLQLIEKAENGDPKAQTELGDIYYGGVNDNKFHIGGSLGELLASAFKWYKMAADQDYAPAFHKVGHLYLQGCRLFILIVSKKTRKRALGG